MMSPAKLTLKEIALKLGVSTATISNAFNRPDQLSEKKRLEILAACKDMGYNGPNKAARSLRKGKTNIIALVLADSLDYLVSDPVASQFIKGVTKAIKNTEAKLLLFSGSDESINDVVDFVDGFICYGFPRNPQLVEELRKTHKRVVTVDFTIPQRPAVNIDNYLAAYQSASIALNGEIRRPAILGLRLIDCEHTCAVGNEALLSDSYSIAHERLRGYQKAIEEKDLSISNNNIWHIPESTHDYAVIAAREALNQPNRPDVLLCMSDVIALTAMQEALNLGLKIPKDIRIMGFDGIDLAKRYHPTLATVQQFSEEKGSLAAQMFLSEETENKTLPFELITGNSAPY